MQHAPVLDQLHPGEGLRPGYPGPHAGGRGRSGWQLAAHGFAVEAELHQDALVAGHSEGAPLVQAFPDGIPRLAVGEDARERVRHGVDQAGVGISEAHGVVVARGGRRQPQAGVQVALPRLFEHSVDRSDLEAALDARISAVGPVGRPAADVRDHHGRHAGALQHIHHVSHVRPVACRIELHRRGSVVGVVDHVVVAPEPGAHAVLVAEDRYEVSPAVHPLVAADHIGPVVPRILELVEDIGRPGHSQGHVVRRQSAEVQQAVASRMEIQLLIRAATVVQVGVLVQVTVIDAPLGMVLDPDRIADTLQ